VAWTFVILGVAVVAFVSGKVPVPVVAVAVAVALWATGVLTLPEALGGFADPTVVFIASLFVVSDALDASGVTAWAGRQVVLRAGRRRIPILLFTSAIVAALTALISINGAVAALAPVAVVVARRAGLAPSQLLIPVAFAASSASLLTLTGTPVNIIVSELAADNGGRPFGFFEFALVGIPVLIGAVAILVLGKPLLPVREAEAMHTDLSVQASHLRDRYALDVDTATLYSARTGTVEVILPPRSELIGLTAFPGMVMDIGGLVILGVSRGGVRMGEDGADIVLQPGDALLLQGPWAALEAIGRGPDVLITVEPRAMRRSVPLGRGARRTLVITCLMVVLLVTGVVPAAIAGLLAAGAIIVTRVVSLPHAYRAISWTTVLLIAGMMAMSTAFATTGAADALAGWLLGWLGGAGPHAALLVLCLVTVVLGQFVSNMATVLIVAPVAVSVAQALDLSVLPFMMALTVAGAASFLTPVATPANLMVMEPGGYRFGDYWRLGLPLAALFILMAVLYVPLVWPFAT
jgi:di/tricarboxylate transporter